MTFVDSHCHLNYPGLVEDTASVLARMQAAGVKQALNICTTLEEADQVLALASAHSFLFASVGVHPDNQGVQEPRVEDLMERAQSPKIIAIGETGLDYYPERVMERPVTLGGNSPDFERIFEQREWSASRSLCTHERLPLTHCEFSERRAPLR